jgi:hypothetical protein
MNSELEQLATSIALGSPQSSELALQFSLACAKRVEHLLEEPEIVECLRVLEQYVAGGTTREVLYAAADKAARLANGHQGSKSIDGCGHAAVSASYGISKAVAGKAQEAAQYCAYASVYAMGGYAAVADREAFEPEFKWQLQCLRSMAQKVL